MCFFFGRWLISSESGLFGSFGLFVVYVVCGSSLVVDVGALHCDGVLDLCVLDGDVVAYNGWSVRSDGSIIRAFMSQRSSRIFRMEWRSRPLSGSLSLLYVSGYPHLTRARVWFVTVHPLSVRTFFIFGAVSLEVKTTLSSYISEILSSFFIGSSSLALGSRVKQTRAMSDTLLLI